jgi:hypothetical protein
MTYPDVTIARLRRKIEGRDKRIAGLQRRIADLEHALATQTLRNDRLPGEVTKAVQRALCNVRLIPMLGIGGHDRIAEIRLSDAEKEPK